MRRYALVLGLAVLAPLAAAPAGAVRIALDFEGSALGPEWTVEGASLSAEQVHSGEAALYLGTGQVAEYRFSEYDLYGTVTMWVYDPGTQTERTDRNGPRWGLANSFGDKFVINLNWRPYLDGNHRYSHIATSQNAWFSRWDTDLIRTAGWHKFTFIHTDANTLRVVMDDEFEAELQPIDELRFQWGFNGLYFYGGDEGVGGVYVDDIQIEAE